MIINKKKKSIFKSRTLQKKHFLKLKSKHYIARISLWLTIIYITAAYLRSLPPSKKALIELHTTTI